MDKSLPANAGDTGSIPVPEEQLSPSTKTILSLCSKARGPQPLKPQSPKACAPQQEKLSDNENSLRHNQSSPLSPQ